MNVLFVLHGKISSNSGIHVHDYANRLALMGVDCAVTVPDRKSPAAGHKETRYQLQDFDETLRAPRVFANGRGPDIVHAWTPREIVRKFCDKLTNRCAFKQVIHLEDNEEHLSEVFTGQKIRSLKQLSCDKLDALIPPHVFHPLRGEEFLRSADGVTLIIDQLGEFATRSTPTITLWPSADEGLFFERPLNHELRHKLLIPDEATVLVYCGNVTGANAREVRSLYLAAALLNREGVPTTLIRTGVDYCDFLGEDSRWAAPFVKNLGWVERETIPDLIAAANILVQSGKPDRFNAYRFPSKIPEFFAIGRPVILPATNVGLHARHASDAFILSSADGENIAEAVETIRNDEALYKRLAAGALEFFRSRLNGRLAAERLAAFYSAVLEGRATCSS